MTGESKRGRRLGPIERLESRHLLTATATAAADFSGYGAVPYDGVVADAAGDLFGVTQAGGPARAGTVYEVPVGTALPVTLYAFTGGATDGGSPGGPPVIDAAGDLFGLTHSGGAGGSGVLFELPHGGPAVVPLADNATTLGGAAIDGLAADAAGDLFGCTYDTHSAFAPAHVFECAATQGRPVTLTPFPDSGLSGLTVAADGDVYGFCSYHGLTADGNISPGTVFRIAADGGRYDAVDTLATFPSALPVEPSAGPPVVDAAGDVFGVFAVNHDLFELPAGSAALELAAPFAHSATAIDVGRLSVDSAGDVYGTTVEQAGTFRDQFGGSAFEIPAGTDFSTLDTVDTVATITVATDAVPSGPLLIRPDGVLVGTVTPYLSLGSVGTVFEAGGPAAPVAATTTTLSAAIPVVDAGAADTFTAAVSPQPAGGSVTFVSTTAGGPRVTLGTAALAADGTATFTTTLTTSANAEQTVVAVYGGDAADAPSTSAATAVGVVAAPTVTTLTLTAPISFGIGTVGQPQQLAATLDYANVVLPTQPTGTVTFYAGTTLLGTADVSGYYRTATLTTSALPNGYAAVTATYAGDAWFAASTSDTFITRLTGPGLLPSSSEQTLPSQIAPGEAVDANLEVDLTNTTAAPISGMTTVAVYASSDVILDGTDFVLATASRTLTIPVLGTSYTATFVPAPVPSISPDLPLGRYHLLATATDPAGDSNVAVLPYTVEVVPPAPSLVATLTLVNPRTYQLSVANDGTAPTRGRLTIDLSLTSAATGSVRTTHRVTRTLTLKPGGRIVLRLPVVRPRKLPDGAYVPSATVSIPPDEATATAGVPITIPARRLFADAEAVEDATQHVVRRDGADD